MNVISMAKFTLKTSVNAIKISTLTSRAIHAQPTSTRSTGFCAIWDCISSSSIEFIKPRMKHEARSFLRIANAADTGKRKRLVQLPDAGSPPRSAS